MSKSKYQMVDALHAVIDWVLGSAVGPRREHSMHRWIDNAGALVNGERAIELFINGCNPSFGIWILTFDIFPCP